MNQKEIERREEYLEGNLEKVVDFSLLKNLKEKLLLVPEKDRKIYYLKYIVKSGQEKVSKQTFLESVFKVLGHLFNFEEAFHFAVSIRFDKNLKEYRLYLLIRLQKQVIDPTSLLNEYQFQDLSFYLDKSSNSASKEKEYNGSDYLQFKRYMSVRSDPSFFFDSGDDILDFESSFLSLSTESSFPLRFSSQVYSNLNRKEWVLNQNLVENLPKKEKRIRHFEISSKYLWITYSGCPPNITMEQILEALKVVKYDNYAISKENHETDGIHFHLILSKATTKFRLLKKSILTLEIDGHLLIPYLRPAGKGGWKSLFSYLKDHDEVDTNYPGVSLSDKKVVSIEQYFMNLIYKYGQHKAFLLMKEKDLMFAINNHEKFFNAYNLELKANRVVENRQSFLDTIPLSNYAFDKEGDVYKIIANFLTRGCGSGALVITGPPGCGKTTLANSIAFEVSKAYNELMGTETYFPLIIRDIDSLKNYNHHYHKFLIFDNVNFGKKPSRELMINLLQNSKLWEPCRIRYKLVQIAPYTPRIIITNDIRGIFPDLNDNALICRSSFLHMDQLIPIVPGSNCFQDMDINFYPYMNDRIVEKVIADLHFTSNVINNNIHINNININFGTLDQEKITELSDKIKKQLSAQFFGPLTGEAENRRNKHFDFSVKQSDDLLALQKSGIVRKRGTEE